MVTPFVRAFRTGAILHHHGPEGRCLSYRQEENRASGGCGRLGFGSKRPEIEPECAWAGFLALLVGGPPSGWGARGP